VTFAVTPYTVANRGGSSVSETASLHLEIVRKADVNGSRPLRMMVEARCSPQHSSARMISKRR
jgi:hypothetical protein